MLLALIVFAVVALVGAPLWVAVVAGGVVWAVRAVSASRRRQRRARRAAELARRREAVRAERRTQRKAAIRARTGLDVDLVGRAAQDAVHAVGSRITRRLEARYASPPSSDDWLDLDTDLGALRSRTRTAEALRLSDELSRARHETS
jgi:hypothetical protein